MTSAPRDITRLLLAWNDGDEAALEELTPLVYAELHRLARRYMGRERSGHTLQTSALVTWNGEQGNVPAAQRAFTHRARMNALASLGQYKPELDLAA